MQNFKKISALVLALCVICASIIVVNPLSASAEGVVANWGLRNVIAKSVSTYAADFYAGDYTYEKLLALDGGTSAETAPSSDLYDALQTLMTENHTTVQSYDATRDYYMYTDCVNGDSTKLSLFYSDKLVNSTWDSGATYNREHLWPKSKALVSGSTTNDAADIMMLRPANSSTNSSRGNKAFGISDGYFNPVDHVKGDCARALLYGYVRWGNTANMWGTEGVMESVEVLLDWCEKDPVDTWELGRNDAVQSITGTRNAFVDYPELAFELFGEEAPATMSTPSNALGTAGAYTGIPESEKPSDVLGDVDNSGVLDAADLVIFRNAVVGKTTISEIKFVVFDFNGDEVFDVRDLIRVKRRLAGIIYPAPVYVIKESYPMADVVSEFGAGAQYGNETYQLDSDTVLTTNKAWVHANGELRLYSSSTNDSTAVLSFTRELNTLNVNVGNAADTLNVYGSVDGSEYTLIYGIETTAAAADYTVTFIDTGYKYLKLDVAGSNQLRIYSLGLVNDPNAQPNPEPEEPEPEEPTPDVSGAAATFGLGTDDSSKTEADGSELKEDYTETNNGYTLTLTDYSKVYKNAYDAKGNGCLKLGSSSAAGSFSFTVPADVTSVRIYVAGYKGKVGKFAINGGTTQVTTKYSQNAEYDVITVDTSTTKTVSFTTVSGGYRVKINTIEFVK